MKQDFMYHQKKIKYQKEKNLKMNSDIVNQEKKYLVILFTMAADKTLVPPLELFRYKQYILSTIIQIQRHSLYVNLCTSELSKQQGII